jgi:hypothetical protein
LTDPSEDNCEEEVDEDEEEEEEDVVEEDEEVGEEGEEVEEEGEDGADEEDAEGEDEAEGESRNVLLYESSSSEEVVLKKEIVRRSAKELRTGRKIFPNILLHAVKMGKMLLGEPSFFRDSLGFWYKVDLLGAAKQHSRFVARVEKRDKSCGEYPALALSALKDSPRLPDDWSGPLVVVVDFLDCCLVATRVGNCRC